MNDVMTESNAAIKEEHQCKIEDVFDQNFIELISLVPRNPYVRALILKLTGKMPGQEKGTFDQIKEWVETNCVKRLRPNRPARGSREDGISINVEFSETEYGRADYSVSRSGSEEFHIAAGELMEMIRVALESSGGIDEVVDLIAGKIDEDAWELCAPNMDGYGEYNYSEHDANDSGDGETDYSRSEIQNAVLAFVRERHPELAAEL